MAITVRKLTEVDYDHPVTGSECSTCGNFEYYEVKTKKFISVDETEQEIAFYRCTKCAAKKEKPYE